MSLFSGILDYASVPLVTGAPSGAPEASKGPLAFDSATGTLWIYASDNSWHALGTGSGSPGTVTVVSQDGLEYVDWVDANVNNACEDVSVQVQFRENNTGVTKRSTMTYDQFNTFMVGCIGSSTVLPPTGGDEIPDEGSDDGWDDGMVNTDFDDPYEDEEPSGPSTYTYTFDTPINTSGEPEEAFALREIEEFTSGQDKIELSRAVFAYFTELGEMSSANLTVVSGYENVLGGNYGIIYDKDTGRLYYKSVELIDFAGGSTNGPFLFAVLKNAPPDLSASDFTIIE